MGILLIIPGAFIAAAILGWLYRLLVRVTFSRGTVIAEYEAPHLLSAAELGYLVDKDFGDNELLGTAVSLTGKGFIDLRKHEPGNPLLMAHHIKDARFKELNDAEITVFSTIRSQKAGTISWNELSNVFSRTLGAKAAFEHEVRQMLVKKGYINSSSLFAFQQTAKYLVHAALFLLIAGLAFAYFYTAQTSLSGGYNQLDKDINLLTFIFICILVWLPTAYYLQLLFLTFYLASDQPVKITAKFRRHWPDVAGFQLFVKTVEFSRLSADTNPYDEAMPYALALGFKPDLDKMTDLALRK